MNQPTEDRIKKIEEKQEDIDKRLIEIERRTEPIPVTRVEVASADALNQLKALEHGQQEISRKQDEQFTHIKKEFSSIEERQKRQDEVLFAHSKHISTLHEEVKGARADFLQVRDSQADLRDRLIELKDTMVTKEDLKNMATDITELKSLVQQLLQRKPSEGQP